MRRVLTPSSIPGARGGGGGGGGKGALCPEGPLARMLLLEPLFLLHELPNADGDILVQVIVPEVLGDLRAIGLLEVCLPVGLATPTVVIHADGARGGGLRTRRCALDGADGFWYLLRRRRTVCPLGLEGFLGLGRGGDPLFHLVPVAIPDAIHAPAHAAVVRLVGPRGYEDAGDRGAPLAQSGQAFGPLYGTGEPGAEDDARLFLSGGGRRGGFGRDGGSRVGFGSGGRFRIVVGGFGLLRRGFLDGGSRGLRGGGGGLLGLDIGDGLGFYEDGLVVWTEGEGLFAGLAGGAGR